MVSNIPKDADRFNRIVKGNIRKDLKDLIAKDDLIGRRGKDKVVIPVPHINLPRFKHGDNKDDGGVGQGDGDIGDKVKPADKGEEGDDPKAGEDAGEHMLELTVEELAEIMGEELKLPRIEPRGKRTIYQQFDHYSGLRRKGPRALMRFKRTHLQALKRQIASGEYNPNDPMICIEKDDMRYRSWKTKDIPESSAVVMYLMDVSGSMSDRHKSIARKIASWTDVWLRANYKGLESRYIIHDSVAAEVDEETFYKTTTSGGTKIVSGYIEAQKIIKQSYDPADWNIYLFQFSDGDNWGNNEDEFNVLKGGLMQALNLLCYAQIDVPWFYNTRSGGKSEEVMGGYLGDLEKFIKESKYKDKLLTARLQDEEDILPAIQTFLGTGK